MKDIVSLEINSKKDTLGVIDIKTPSELLLVNHIEPILNNKIFDEFIDEIFELVITELVYEFDEKIDNVFATFVNDDGVLICSIQLDRFKPKKGLYRRKVIDWEHSGYVFKYADDITTEEEQ